jgi:hypothetical protein
VFIFAVSALYWMIETLKSIPGLSRLYSFKKLWITSWVLALAKRMTVSVFAEVSAAVSSK